MKRKTAEQILEDAGISEREAWTVIVAYLVDVLPRIRYAFKLHKLDKLKRYQGSRVRCIPWPHVAEYNRLMEELVMAETMSELKVPIIDAKEQVIRRMLFIGAIVFQTGPSDKVDLDRIFSERKADMIELMCAKDIVRKLMLVGNDAMPQFHGAEWFPEWVSARACAAAVRGTKWEHLYPGE